MKRGLLVLAMVFTLVGYATAEPITAPSQLSPNPTIIDFEQFTAGRVSSPLVIGGVTFVSQGGYGGWNIRDITGYLADGTEVAHMVLEPVPRGLPMTITFPTPVSEVLLGWWDPNFAGNFLRAYDINNQLIEEVELTDLGPVGGAYATWIGFKRPSADISKVIMEAARSPAADFFAVDNIHYNTIQSCVQPPSGLVSWLPLDEVNGTTTPDIIGGNDGTLVNGPIQVVGKVADALSFDGIDDYVDLGSNSSLNIPGSVTIDAWVRFFGFVGGWYSYFVADFDRLGWTSQLSLGVVSGAGNFQFFAYEGRSSSDNTYVYSSADKTEGRWYHVAVVRDDAAKTIKLYVNGNLEGSNSYAGKVPVSLQGNKYLGSSSPFNDYFNGVWATIERVSKIAEWFPPNSSS